jgi:hypothetical protein
METTDEQTTDEQITPETPAHVSAWKLGGLSWRQLGRRVWLEIYAGLLLTHAAALAFYFLFALVAFSADDARIFRRDRN